MATITIRASGGSVDLSGTGVSGSGTTWNADSGTVVTVTVTPTGGTTLMVLKWRPDTGGSWTDIAPASGNTSTFTMPGSGNVTIVAQCARDSAPPTTVDPDELIAALAKLDAGQSTALTEALVAAGVSLLTPDGEDLTAVEQKLTAMIEENYTFNDFSYGGFSEGFLGIEVGGTGIGAAVTLVDGSGNLLSAGATLLDIAGVAFKLENQATML